MDFSIKKPAHILALLAILFVFFILYVMPALSLLNLLPSTEGKELTEPVILLSSVITVLIFIGTPLLWYLFVNKFSIKEMLRHLKLRAERIDAAFLWGIVVAAVVIAMMIVIGALLYRAGVNQEDLSNIEDIAGNIPIVSMLFIIVFQSIAEEIFFRGFLLEKIESIAGGIMAIFITAILFGLAHMSYGKIYPVIMPIMMGIFLGFVVFKTKNLYSAITAHMLFNLTSFILYIFAKSLS
ncbi:MAG: type II CAAX endopeptidase family protein [Euryarchaeota archaeon]|nr:type II CAAX endopeptidase family protein [Euryarchaeota archaeon]